MGNGFRLEQPNETHEKAYKNLVQAWDNTGIKLPRMLLDENYPQVLLSFSKYKKADLPYSTYLLMKDDKALGVVTLRHKLDTFLQEFGGHLSYSIRPDERGKGLEQQVVALCKQAAKVDLALKTLIVTVSDSNQPMKNAIENNGGQPASQNERGGIEYITYRISL